MATAEAPPAPDTLCTEAIISRIPLNVTGDHLINFLECKVPECHVEQVQFKKEDAALVIFENTVDLKVLQTSCENELLEGRMLHILPVDQRGAVLIRNPCPRTTTNSFKFYLSNKKRSGGSGVEHIYRDDGHLFLIAYYHSRKEAEQVAQRKHTLESQELQLEFFDPNFDELPKSDGDQSFTPSAKHESLVSLQSNTCFTESVDTYNYPSIVPDMGAVGNRNGPEERLKEPQDATIHERERKYSIRDVKGLCLVYQKILDVLICSTPKQQLDVQMEIEHGGVKIQGEQHNVAKAEALICCLCEKQESSEFVNRVAAVFDGWDDMFDDIQAYVDRGECCLVIQEGAFGVEEFVIQCIHSHQSLSFDDFLRRYVSQKTVAVKSKQAEELLGTTSWELFRECDMDIKFGNQVAFVYNEKDHLIEVIGSVQCLDEAVQSVELFLNNVHVEQQFSLLSTEKEILLKFWFRDSTSIQSGTDVDFAVVSLDGCLLNIKGHRAGVRRDIKKFETFRKHLKCKRAIFIHPGLATFQQRSGDLLRDFVRTISTENKCLITELPDPQVPDADEDHEDWGQWVAAVIHSFTAPGQCLELHVVEGQTEDLKVDAVVVCCENNTLHQPPVPQPQGGARPKSYHGNQEHRTLVQQREGIHVTQPGARPGKAVVQVSLPFYFSSDPRTPWDVSADRLMADLFKVCDRYHFGSMALPVFGVDVGEGLKPIDVATKILTKSITEHCCQEGRSRGYKKSRSLKQLFLCSPRAACLHALIYALQDDLAWSQSSPTQQSFKFLSSEMPKPRTKGLNSGAIEIHKGDISRAQVDALVVPCDIDIDLDLYKSQVTRSLLHGGSGVQTSLQKGDSYFTHDTIENRNEELAERRILTGGGGTLKAKHIFYVFLPPWGPNAKQMLIECVQKSLHQATAKKCRLVALTCLGVGKLDYPPRYAARTALSAVSHFMDTQATSLKTVQFVICDHTTFGIYKEEHNGWLQQHVWCSVDSAREPLVYPHHTVPTSPRGHSSYPSHGSSTEPPVTRPRGSHGHAARFHDSLKIRNIKLRVKIGDITREKCDVIVNSTNCDFDFKRGGVSRAIEKSAGEFLVRLCNEKKNKKEMKKTGVVVTGAPGLSSCEAVLHLDLDTFKQKPKEMLFKCFTTLLKKHPKTETVAFPLLGAGSQRFHGPGNTMKSMKEALQGLDKPKQLREVQVVVSSADLYQSVVACLHPPVVRHASPPPAPYSPQPNVSRPPSKGPAASNTVSSPSSSSTVLVTKVPRSKWADRNALSLFIFSDIEENWQRACCKLAEELESCLGPVKAEPEVAGPQPGFLSSLSDWWS